MPSSEKPPEWSNEAIGEGGLYGEWDDSQYDPKNLPDWELEDGLPEEPSGARKDPRFEHMVENLEEELEKDVGFANEQSSIDVLARMFIEDRANYARCEAILRRHKLTNLVRTSVRARARMLSNVDPVPGGGEALDLIRVKVELPGAPVHPDAVIPAMWLLDGSDGGQKRFRLVRKVVKKNQEGHYVEQVGVAYAPLVISGGLVSVDDGAAHLRISWPTTRGWRHRVVPRQKLLQPRDIIDVLGGAHGFPVNVNNAKELIAYIVDYEAFNEEVIRITPMSSRMGWQGQDYELGFLSGQTTIKADDSQPDVRFVGADDGETQLARCVQPKGTLDGWLRGAKLTAHFPAVEVAIYASLATPLLKILGAPNFTVDWSHKTSAGKTTALSVAASVWGNPDPNASDSIMASWDMTAVGFERRAAALSGLPLIVDDSKRAKSWRGNSVVPGVVYAITNGQGKIRGSIKGTAKTAYWRTVMLSSGEQRLIDFDKSGGTPARVVTLWCNPFGANNQFIAEVIRKIKTEIHLNYGLAGPAFVKWLLDNQGCWPELRIEHGKHWTSYRDQMIRIAGDQTMDMSVLDRVAGNLAVIEVASNCARMALGLPWEQENVIEQLLEMIVPAAGTVDRELEALRAAVSWAAQNQGKFIVNEKHRRDNEPHGGWLGYWEAGQNDSWEMLSFFPGALRDFLRGQGFEPQSIIRQWAEAKWLDTSESNRFTRRIGELNGRPRMVVVPREVVETWGELGGDTDEQAEIPF